MAIRGHNFFLFGLLALAILLLMPETAMAQVDLKDSGGSFTGLLDLIQQKAGQWDEKLRDYATRLFWLLVSIQFVWTFFPLVFKQADFGEIVGELIRFILVTGFFLALLTFSTTWGAAVVDSFREAGGQAAGYGKALKPGDIFGVAVELADTIGNVETWNPLTAFMVSLAGIIVLLCFAFIAAFMGLTIIESYIVINASVLFMGFGASQWTREFALAVVRYAVSVGAKLFILTLLVGLIVDSAKTWQAAYNNDSASMWTMIGLALACAYFAKTIPEMIAGLIAGTSSGGGSSIGGMAAAAAAGAAAAVATIATAGAAAPAAAAAAGTGASGAATGGLAGAINASMAGGSGAGAASSAASGATSAGSTIGGASSASGGAASGASNAAKSASASPRVGGGTGEGVAPKAPGSSTGGGGQQTGSSGVQQAAQEANKAAKAAGKDDDSPAPAPSAQPQQQAPEQAQASEAPQEPAQAAGSEEGGISGRSIASALTRGSGILSAMSVPGMEGSAALSLGAPPPGADASSGQAGSGDMAPNEMSDNGPENVIRPADAPSAPVAESTPTPAAAPTTDAPKSEGKS
ncbi:P-type conjugative transfer protein TrbL [Escherichia coli]|uniref:P-type conjugative transfer protein TrbL n=1 Tax=Escherichia coli TaxID=562 RepID=UPI000DA4925C|nr:P-type conjugative transfer protein TrbL [Escherichia coli]SQY61130.1 P-type conjugative transfer protein TrbL [Escherichia coli]